MMLESLVRVADALGHTPIVYKIAIPLRQLKLLWNLTFPFPFSHA